MTETQQQQLVNKFNSQFPVGAKVHWRSVGSDGVPYETVTVRAPAFIAASGHAVVFFNEHRGYCSIDEPFTLYDIIPSNEPDPSPIDMILPCPSCGMLHVDAPEPDICECKHSFGLHGEVLSSEFESRTACHECECDEFKIAWTNPPHRSHKCHGCSTVWRPADVATNGVAEINTRGKADTWPRRPKDEKRASTDPER